MKQLLKGIDKRPLLKGKSQEEIWEYYDHKLQERLPFYNQAQLHAKDLNYIEIGQMMKSGWL
jgi:predicted house-cleaning noncanonical NTP pyrophosphatase (MazG superfamily)